MNFGEFLRVDRTDEDGRLRHYVVHVTDPKFVLEVSPDEVGGKGPRIRRIRIPNSFTGDYHKYAKLIGAAEAFFLASDPPAAESPAAGNVERA